jgi:Cu/Ag efflux protein CusF
MSVAMITALATTGFPASSKTRQITGKVTAIDTRSNTVTVLKKGKEVVVNVEEKTDIIQCTQKPSITDIKIGDKVTAKYKETGGENTARSITIREETKKTIPKK